MSNNVDSWWKKFVKFFTPLPKEELQSKKVKKEVLEKAIKDAEVVLKKFDDELQAGKIYDAVREKPKRARTKKGTYKGDDKSTPNVNEAWEGGKAPKEPAAKKTKVTRIKKKK